MVLPSGDQPGFARKPLTLVSIFWGAACRVGYATAEAGPFFAAFGEEGDFLAVRATKRHRSPRAMNRQRLRRCAVAAWRF